MPSWLQGQRTYSARSIQKWDQRAYFVMKRGSVPIGMGERCDDTMVMVLAFVSQPQHRVRFKFHDVIRVIAEDDSRLEANIDLALTKLSG